MRTKSLFLVTAMVFVTSFILVGCPKRPEVGSAGAGAIGPAAAVVSPASGGAGATVTDTPVVPPAGMAVETATTSAQEAEPAVTQTTANGGAVGAEAAASQLKDIFFDYDRSSIRPDQAAGLRDDVAWLTSNAGKKVTIEGHCDERGTSEYNVALGERRAQAVKDYLVAAGVPADRISIVSYGKERPFVVGHDESAWKWNRRGHFVVE